MNTCSSGPFNIQHSVSGVCINIDKQGQMDGDDLHYIPGGNTTIGLTWREFDRLISLLVLVDTQTNLTGEYDRNPLYSRDQKENPRPTRTMNAAPFSTRSCWTR